LVINGRAAEYVVEGEVNETVGGLMLPALRLEETAGDAQRHIQWLPALHHAANFAPIVVPADHYLMLGDNRDDSADSRYFGFVPRKLLIGRAERILVSAAIKEDWRPRFDRFGMALR
jgi:signal peptidase I